MKAGRIHVLSSRIVLAFSFLALVTVLTGYFQAPIPDEGTGAHIFQLSIVLLCPALLVFLCSAKWTEPRQTLRLLVPAGLALALPFAALYYLEHYWYARLRCTVSASAVLLERTFE